MIIGLTLNGVLAIFFAGVLLGVAATAYILIKMRKR